MKKLNRKRKSKINWPLTQRETVNIFAIGLASGLIAIMTITFAAKSAGVRQVVANIPVTHVVNEGDVARNTAFKIKLSNVHSAPGADPAFKLEEGHHFLVFTLSVTNTSAKTQYFWPVYQTFVRDSIGRQFTMSPTMTIKSPFQAGAIAPGATQIGELSYDLNKDAESPRVYIDPAWDSSLPAIFNLITKL